MRYVTTRGSLVKKIQVLDANLDLVVNRKAEVVKALPAARPDDRGRKKRRWIDAARDAHGADESQLERKDEVEDSARFE